MKRLTHAGAILLSAAMLCFLSIYNGFPLVFNNDTGMYIENAFNGVVASDRPIMYGLFIYFSSMVYSLWLVIAAQALIVALMVYYCFRYFTAGRTFLLSYLLFMAVVAFFMSASFEVSWLMPDIFTAIALLCVILLTGRKVKLRDKIIVSLIMVLSIGVHNSNFYTCTGLCLLLLFFKRIRIVYSTTRRILYTLSIILLGYLNLTFVHYLYSGELKSSRGGTIFLMSNLVEMGIVDIYLSENCDQRGFRICAYQGTLPNNFLWSENSPIKKTGGWDANMDEYSAIISDIVTNPRYLRMIVYKSAIYTFKQFFNYDIVDIGKPSERINKAVEYFYIHEYKQHKASRESKDRLLVGFINFTQQIIVCICLCLYLYLLIYQRSSPEVRSIILFMFIALLVNAWVCSTFSGVFPRYQTRIIWLLPLPLFLYCQHFFPNLNPPPLNGTHNLNALPQ
jgi:hypothetical protein